MVVKRRTLRRLPVLLAINVASSSANAIPPPLEVAGAGAGAQQQRQRQDVRGGILDTKLKPQVLPLTRRARLTPTQSPQENEPLVGLCTSSRGRSSSAGLLASLPRAGGIGGGKGKVNGMSMLDRVRNKNKQDGLPSPGSELQKAVAVNAVSWAAVVGGTLLWSRTKMSSEEGTLRYAVVVLT